MTSETYPGGIPSALPYSGQCPPWCDEAGQPTHSIVEAYDGGAFTLLHEYRMGEGVWLGMTETSAGPHGPTVSEEEASLEVVRQGRDATLTADQARGLAAVLLRAAELLDQTNAERGH